MKLFNAITDRLGFFCALVTMACIGLIFPDFVKGMLADEFEEFSTDEVENEDFQLKQ